MPLRMRDPHVWVKGGVSTGLLVPAPVRAEVEARPWQPLQLSALVQTLHSVSVSVVSRTSATAEVRRREWSQFRCGDSKHPL